MQLTWSHAIQCTNTLSLRAMWEFKVAQAVPLEGSISYEELTAKVETLNNNLPIGVLNLRRLVRHAITNRVFCEPKKNQVAHTRTSRLLLEDEPLSNWVGFCTYDMWLPLVHVTDAMKKWPASDEPTETSVNLAFNQSLPWFEFIQKDKAFAQRYNLAMKAHGGAAGYDVKYVVEGYPWGDLGDATIVDVSTPRVVCRPDPTDFPRWAGTKGTYPLPSQKPSRASSSLSRIRRVCARQRPLGRYQSTLAIESV